MQNNSDREIKYIIDFLKEYDRKNMVRFHMPGHKGKNLKEISNLFPSLDITEINGSDNLHYPETIIRNSEERAAELYGAKETIFMVNGSTASIYSAITGTVKEGEKLILQRDSHKAAYNALITGGIVPEYIYPEYDSELELNLGISAEKSEKRLRELLEDEKTKAVFITYPNYYGIAADLERIAETVHEYGKVLIADEAHGSHFKFDRRLPKSAGECGADIVIQSTHKTLLGLTQTSMIHLCSDRVSSEDIRRMSRIYQSTSPSYVLMASLDLSVQEMKEGGGREKLSEVLNILEKEIYNDSELTGEEILRKEEIEKRGFSFDMMKIVFGYRGRSGKEIENIMREKFMTELEMSDHRYGVALSSLMDSEEDIKTLKNALVSLKEMKCNDRTAKKYEDKEEEEFINAEYSGSKRIKAAEMIYTPREVFYKDSVKTELHNSEGLVSADMVIPYPPGVPALAYGELITEEIIDYIEYLLKKGISVQGIENGLINTVARL